jgi:hypothetical protein
LLARRRVATEKYDANVNQITILVLTNGDVMSETPNQNRLEAVLNSWNHNNTILLNLLRALPEGGLEARALESRPQSGFDAGVRKV